MGYVAGLARKSFDPQVVDILKANYREFEGLAQSTPLRNHRLSKDLIVSRGEAPDAGYEEKRFHRHPGRSAAKLQRRFHRQRRARKCG